MVELLVLQDCVLDVSRGWHYSYRLQELFSVAALVADLRIILLLLRLVKAPLGLLHIFLQLVNLVITLLCLIFNLFDLVDEMRLEPLLYESQTVVTALGWATSTLWGSLSGRSFDFEIFGAIKTCICHSVLLELASSFLNRFWYLQSLHAVLCHCVSMMSLATDMVTGSGSFACVDIELASAAFQWRFKSLSLDLLKGWVSNQAVFFWLPEGLYTRTIEGVSDSHVGNPLSFLISALFKNTSRCWEELVIFVSTFRWHRILRLIWKFWL